MAQSASAAISVRPLRVLLKMLRLVRKYWKSYLSLVLIVSVSALIPLGNAEGMRRLFNAVHEASLSKLSQAAIFMGGILIGGMLIEFIRTWFMQDISNRTILHIQRIVLQTVFMKDLLEINKWHTGDKIQRLNDSTTAAQDGINNRIPKLVEQVLSIGFLFLYLTILSWRLMAGWSLPYLCRS